MYLLSNIRTIFRKIVMSYTQNLVRLQELAYFFFMNIWTNNLRTRTYVVYYKKR